MTDRRIMATCLCRVAVLGPCCAMALAVGVGVVHAAEDKNGGSPNTISRPTGPGSLEGLGDAFQPALNTGTARYAVKLLLPPGVAGFSPELALRYESGRGFGVAGFGWTYQPGSIRRQTDKGLPRYIDPPGDGEAPDRFIGIEGEELVRLANGAFLCKVEGAYIRYRPVDEDGDGKIDSWIAHTKSGVKMEFGLTPTARITDAAGPRIYRWCLERQTDTNGNVITYAYERPSDDDRQVYCTEIRYGPGAGPWTNYYSVEFDYEDRPDPFTDYRNGFKVRTARRLTRIDVTFTGRLIRRYVLGYGAHPHWSLLTTIRHLGETGERGQGRTDTLPDTTFGYARPVLPAPGTAISAAGKVISSDGGPAQVMDSALVELIDLNADGLPDLLRTDVGHTAYLNRGVVRNDDGATLRWAPPIDVTTADPRTTGFELRSPAVHLADMTGDALADLVVTSLTTGAVEYFANTGQGWGAGQRMEADQPPPAPFGPGNENVVTADLDFDKRIDVLKSEAGAYTVWFNLDGNRYSAPMLRDGVFDGERFVSFGDRGVSLADMNGDRICDVARVTGAAVTFWPGIGFGRFDEPVRMALPADGPGLDDEQIARAALRDIDGDGLADLVVERFNGLNLRFWLNLGDGVLDGSRVITDLPFTPGAETRWADINGNGTTDLLYANSTLPDSKIRAVDIGELIAGSAHVNLLTGIDNGYGRKTTIRYRSSTDYAIDAAQAGHSWTTALPFPTPVVSRTETTISLDLDGYPDEGPNGDTYVTDYVYRDGYYDPLEKQFRGFAFVKQIERGDERFGGTRAPTLVTRYRFHTGAPDGIDNDGDGETDEAGLWTGREEEPLKGVELWRETTVLPDDTADDGEFAPDAQVFQRIVAQRHRLEPGEAPTWIVRDLCTATGGALANLFGESYRVADHYERLVRQAVRTRVDTFLIERGRGPAKHLRDESDLDPLGNGRFEWKHGDLSDPADNIYTGYEYAFNEAAWIVDRVSRAFQTDGGAGGNFVSDVRNYYDGEALVGLPRGQLGERGNLHRTESFVSRGEVPPLTERSFRLGDPRDPAGKVNTLRQKLDRFGNPIELRDANGNERRIEYETELSTYPVREVIVVGGGNPELVVQATYHFSWGKPETITDFNGHVSRFAYDQFGRLDKEFLPGDPADAPTRAYVYDLGAPVSHITTTAHPNEGESPDVITRQFFDGLGRKLGLWEMGGPVMREVTSYNTRGQSWRVVQPYGGGNGTWPAPPPPPEVGAYTTDYDAVSRAVKTVSPPDDAGTTATVTMKYLPLAVEERDGERNRAGGPHFDKPKTLIRDGLDRLIEVHEIELLSPADSGTFITKYRYALPDLLAEIDDASGNIKYMRYDGLGRKIFMNDCNRGHMTYTYDAFGNLLETRDAKSQHIVYTYDGANRLRTEDYLDIGTPLSLERSPDVVYHYDRSNRDYPTLRNTRGQLAWIEDLTGAEFRGFSARAALETTVKRIDQIDGTTKDWMTVMLLDNLDRNTSAVCNSMRAFRA